MQIDTTVYRLERDPSSITYTDLITSGATRSGDVVWHDTIPDMLIIPFTPEPTAAEQWAIIRRLITADAAEEQTYKDVEAAITSSVQWRSTGGQGAQTFSQADSLEDTAALNQANLRLAFTGIKNTVGQLGVVMQRQEWLAQQILKLMNRG